MSDYEVGYKKPPKATRFQKGRSGNPKGRPKGHPNLAIALERELSAKVPIKEGGRMKLITKLEAIVKQLTNKAAMGELKSIPLLVSLLNAGQVDDPSESATTVISEADEVVMRNLRLRLLGEVQLQPETGDPVPEAQRTETVVSAQDPKEVSHEPEP